MMKFLSRLLGLPFRKIQKKVRKSQLTPESNRKRVGKIVFFLSVVLFTVFIFRFVWLITVNRVGDTNIAQMAKSNYLSTVTAHAKRGTIYDRNGQPIALDSSTYTIYAVIDKSQTDSNGHPQFVEKSRYDEVAQFLSDQLGIDKDYALKQLNNPKLSQVQFGSQGSKISAAKMQQMQKDAENKKIVGLGFSSDLARSYPLGNFASQFIGVASPEAGKDGESKLVGTNGLEASYDSILSGEDGVETYQKDALGRPLPGTTKLVKPVKNGQDVYTTLDAPLQQSLENLMNTAVKNSGGKQLYGVLMDAHTGEILASSQRPTFSPTTINSDSKQANFTWNNLMSQQAYEPGSTMKTFLMASALNSGHVDLNATYTRTLKAYDVEINDWDWNEKGYFTLPTVATFAQGFEMSSNVGMSKIEMMMGDKLWDQYLTAFKFGVPTRIGLGGETFGNLPSSNLVSQIQSSFGQGIAVTPIQLLRGWTSFSNEGVMLEPHIVNKIVNTNDNTALQVGKEIIGKPVSSSAVDQVKKLMVGVNTDPLWGTTYGGYAGRPAAPLFTVNGNPMATKSGTAQVASPTGGYLEGVNDVLASAVAMYPPQNPDFIFYMYIKLPDNGISTVTISDVANPLIAQAEARKSQIQATDSSNFPSGKVKLANYVGKESGPTADTLRQQLLAPVVVGKGSKISEQAIASGEEVNTNTRLLLLTDGSPSIPDMYSWTKDQVEQVAKWYDLKITYNGSGDSVSGQSVSAGQSIKRGQSITINMN